MLRSMHNTKWRLELLQENKGLSRNTYSRTLTDFSVHSNILPKRCFRRVSNIYILFCAMKRVTVITRELLYFIVYLVRTASSQIKS